MRWKQGTVIGLLGLSMIGGAFAPASAETRWERHHPRRDQVNDRLFHQQLRITHERREGDLTADQAHSLRSQDHSIREQERADAAANGGHITKSEQRTLNQEENSVGAQIGR